MPPRRLQTMKDVRRYIANLINRIESDEIDTQKAHKIGYLINILSKAIEGSEFESRLEELEKHVETIQNQNQTILHTIGIPQEIDERDLS